MRKSKAIACLLLGSAAMVLASCDKSPEEMHALYPDMDSCLANALPGDEEALCRKAWQQAEADWKQSAPRYQDKAACEAQHGATACQEQPAVAQSQPNAQPGQTNASSGGGSYFMPLMTGFLLSRALSGGGMGFGSQPVYRDKGGFTYAGKTKLDVPPAAASSASQNVFSKTGALNSRGNWDAAPARPQVAGGLAGASRGGFGSTGARYSTSSGG